MWGKGALATELCPGPHVCGSPVNMCLLLLCFLSHMDHSQSWLHFASLGDALRAPHVGKPRYLAIKLTSGI